jgi:hypothetical protein
MWNRIRALLPAVAVAVFTALGIVAAGGTAQAGTAVAAGTASTDACDWSSAPRG